MRITHAKQLLVACLLVAVPGMVFAQDNDKPAKAPNPSEWNQWRGAERTGFDTSKKWPKKIDSNNFKRVWRMEMGPSYSGPVIQGDIVFTTETKDKKFEVVTALNRKTVKRVCAQKWEGSRTVPFFAKSNGSWIRPTPAVSGNRIFVGGMRDLLVCLDSRTGEELWRIDFPKKYGTKNPDFGFVSSPLVHDGHVFVQAGGSFCKIKVEDGKVVWRSLNDGGGMYGSAFSSPYLTELNGKQQMLVQTRDKLTGVDLGSGQVLWSQKVPSFRGMNILTPTVFENSVFTSTYQNSSYMYSIGKTNDGMASRLKWQNPLRGYMSSPIIIDGHAYIHLQNRCLACIDLKTGKEKWKSKRFGKYMSLVAQGTRILALDEKGKLVLFNANPESFELVSTIKVSDEETWAHLAIHNNEVYIRELNAISKFEWSDN